MRADWKEPGLRKPTTPNRAPLALVLLALLSLSCPELRADEPFTFGGDSLVSSFGAGQEQTTLTGNARIVSGSFEIAADRIVLSGKAFRYASCTGQVKVRDVKQNLRIQASALEYDRSLKSSRFEGLCELSDPDRGVLIRAGALTYDEGSETLTLEDSVRIFKGDLVCRSDYGVYSRAAETLELTGLPVVNKKADVYRAGLIRVNLKRDDVLLEGRVSGTITPDTKDKSP